MMQRADDRNRETDEDRISASHRIDANILQHNYVSTNPVYSEQILLSQETDEDRESCPTSGQ